MPEDREDVSQKRVHHQASSEEQRKSADTNMNGASETSEKDEDDDEEDGEEEEDEERDEQKHSEQSHSNLDQVLEMAEEDDLEEVPQPSKLEILTERASESARQGDYERAVSFLPSIR